MPYRLSETDLTLLMVAAMEMLRVPSQMWPPVSCQMGMIETFLD